MTVAKLNFGIQSNPGRFGQDGTGLLTNCYAESRGNEGKDLVGIYASHGYSLFGTEATATKGTRGFIELGDSLYWVVDRQLRKVDGTGASTLIGGLADDGFVSMARNDKANTPQIAIATPGGLRFLLENDVLSPISDTDLPPPIGVAYLDGYMLYLGSGGTVHYSEINDAGNIDALNFFTAEAKPDGAVAIATLGRTALVFGNKTVQRFQNTGATNNPIVPEREIIKYGCLAGGTVKEFDNTIVFVAHERTVRRLNGYTPVKISNTYVDDLLLSETTLENLTGDVYQYQGHEFYVLSGTNFTVVYDAATGLWHTKESSGLNRWQGQGIIQFGQKWIVGDRENGNLYQLDRDVFGENSNDMVMRIRSPIAHSTPNRLRYNKLWLDFMGGEGINTTDEHNANPQVGLRFSDDGANTWSNERYRTLGRIGKYGTRAKFNKLGTEKFKGRVFEVAVSAQVARGFVGAHGDLQQVAG